MESKTKVFGHPLHPMLIVLPLGLFFSAVICDILYLVNHVQFYPVVSYYNIAGGIIGGLLAAIFGFRDWLAIPSGTRAKRIGGWHGLGNDVMVALFLVSWLIRRGDANFVPTTLALFISFSAIILGTLVAWLGGEMVYRLSVAVDQDANLDAPSSLSGQPAGQGRLSGSRMPVTGRNRDQDEK